MGKKQAPKIKTLSISNFFYWANFTLRTSIYNYKSKRRRVSFKRILRFFKPDLNNPIFIVGAPRSGTTFLGKCMEVIPEITYHFEPVATKAAARYVYDSLWSRKKGKLFYKLIYSFLMILHLDPDLRFAEKTPLNACIIPFLSYAFPDAKFIHIIRDGKDSALSYSKKGWHQRSEENSVKYEPGGYLYGPNAHFWVEKNRIEEFESTSDLHRSIWTWRIHTEYAIRDGQKLGKDKYLELKYESLIFNKREEADRILDFLRITNPDSREIFYKAVQGGKPNSVGGWKKEFKEQDLKIIENEAGYLLEKLGYELKDLKTDVMTYND